MATLAEKLQKAVNSKNALKEVLIAKGAAISESTLFSQYATLADAIDTTPEFTNDECLIKLDGQVTKVTKASLITSNDEAISTAAKTEKLTEIVNALDDSHVYVKSEGALSIVEKASFTENIHDVSEYINTDHNIAFKNSDTITSDNITTDDAIVLVDDVISKVTKESLVTSNDLTIINLAKADKLSEIVEALDDSHAYVKDGESLSLVTKASFTDGILDVSDYINDTHNIAYKNTTITSDNITEDDVIILDTTIKKVTKASLIPEIIISSIMLNSDNSAVVTINGQEYQVTSDKVIIPETTRTILDAEVSGDDGDEVTLLTNNE